MNIWIIHPHELLRRGLSAVCVDSGLVDSVQHARSLSAALSRSREFKPTLVIISAEDPTFASKQGLARLSRAIRSAPVVALTNRGQRNAEAFLNRSGLSSCISARLPVAELLDALKRILSGEAVIAMEQADPSTTQGLTRREQDVIQSLAQGNSNKLIGRALGVQEITVKVHLRSIYRKLGVNNRIRAVTRAIELGLVRAPST